MISNRHKKQQTTAHDSGRLEENTAPRPLTAEAEKYLGKVAGIFEQDGEIQFDIIKTNLT